MGLAPRDSDRHTYADYLTWGEEARYELIDGTAYLMAPAPPLEHQDSVGEIFRQLANALAGTRCRVFVAPVDVRLPQSGETMMRSTPSCNPTCWSHATRRNWTAEACAARRIS